MTRKHHSNHGDHNDFRESKREQFISREGKPSSSTGRYISIAVVSVMAIAILCVIFAGKSTGKPDTEAVTAAGQDFNLPISTLSDGKARFYNYEAADGKKLGFFVIKSSDGVIRAAFDACDVCYQSHRGYHQEGDNLVCNNCGRHFPSSKVNDITGGCNPISITRQVQDGNVVIRASDLALGAAYF